MTATPDKSAEQRLRQALEAAGMGTWEWEIAADRITWSAGLEALHGLAPGTFGGTFEAFRQDIHPEDRAHVERSLADTLEHGVDHHIEYRLALADGTQRWVEGTGKLYRDANGRPERMVGVCADITERKRAEEALRESDRRKDEFIAMLSHELRNPLAPLQNGVELLRMQGCDAQTAKIAAMMDRQIRHLVRLVDDLLETSRINRGMLELRRERVLLAEIVTAALETSEPLFRELGHAVEVALADEPLCVEADPVRLAQALTNLLNNAARYTSAGGRIWLSAERAPGRQAVVTVRDSGAGFSAAAKQRIFEMFARGIESQGLGVGLALTKLLVEMHGGQVEARSEGPDRGAEFIVSLPLAEPAEVPAQAEPAARPSGNGLRVLIADDNRDAADSLAIVLRTLGHEVAVAYDGREAAAAARSFRPQVALLDIGMPVLDGYAAARRIRSEQRDGHVQLVALTGWGQEEDRRRVRAAGFDAHVVKPADVTTLRRILDEASVRSGTAAPPPPD